MIVIYFLSGILTGLLTTLFGFGGGFIVVPILFALLPYQGLSQDLAMHMAVGTSLMLMFINMSYASWLQYQRKNINFSVLKKMLPFIIVGAFLGSFMAGYLSASLLKYAFLSLVIIVLAKNLHQEFFSTSDRSSATFSDKGLYSISLVTGTIASLLGIGGSVIIVPYLRSYGTPMLRASALANVLAIPSGLIGSIIFMVLGFHAANLPAYSTGYVYWPALLSIFLASILGAKMGLYFSRILPDKAYGKLYCLVLLGVIACLLFA